MLVPRGKIVTYSIFLFVGITFFLWGFTLRASGSNDGKAFLVFYGICFLGSLISLIRTLQQGNGLTILQSRRSILLDLSSFASAEFGPLPEIEGKTLCFRFCYWKSEHDALNGKPHQPYLQSFKLSPDVPVTPDGIRLHIQIGTWSGSEDTLILSEDKFVAAKEYLECSEMSEEDNELEIAIPYGSKANYIRITNPVEEEVQLRIHLWEVTDLKRVRTRNRAPLPELKASFRGARRQIVNQR